GAEPPQSRLELIAPIGSRTRSARTPARQRSALSASRSSSRSMSLRVSTKRHPSLSASAGSLLYSCAMRFWRPVARLEAFVLLALCAGCQNNTTLNAPVAPVTGLKWEDQPNGILAANFGSGTGTVAEGDRLSR